ncbi:MAG: endonuclease/exonuclease/phosphatase family protein [Clostridiales bacterium]|nr:endonuclease/exonuclease/phosphatase family protein [Clostridiales bacterium]
MVTVSIRFSAKNMCTPLTVNRLLKAVRNDRGILKKFWPRLIKDKSVNFGKKVGVKLDIENLEYLRELKRNIRSTYGIFVSYSMLVCALLRLYKGAKEKVVMSLNVQGYRATAGDFIRRLKGIAEEIKKVLPEVIMLQEFRVGENRMFLKALLRELGNFYDTILPKSYREKEDYNNCICIILKEKNAEYKRIISLKDDYSFRHRYNLVELDDQVIMNVWVPQIFNSKQDRIELAEKMWKAILDMAQFYSYKASKFWLIGDLNAFIDGPFEENIKKLNTLLRDTKMLDDLNRPTGQVNVLDYSFINRFYDQTSLIRTSIFDPSLKLKELSDHEALITTITEL